MFIVALLGSVVMGLVMGWASPRSVHAANVWEIWHDISVGATYGQTVWMHCGWHTTCESPYSTGNALDWDETDNSAYFTGAAKWNGTYNAYGAKASFNNSPTSLCTRVSATIYNYHNNDYLATEYFTHVQRTGTAILYIQAGPGFPYGFKSIVGTVSGKGGTSELSGCPWGGTHVHQYGVSFSATNNGSGDWDPFPNATSCYLDYCWSTSNQTWMHYEVWTH